MVSNSDRHQVSSVLLHCVLASHAVYCNQSCLSVCLRQAGGRAVSEPYYSQRVRSVCISLSAFSICCCAGVGNFGVSDGLQQTH